MKELKWENSLLIADSIDELPNAAHRKLCKAAITAREGAYAPYSNYQVGASVLLTNGKIIHGSNQENAVYPLGLCAERVAIFSAAAQYPIVSIEALAVVTIGSGEDDAIPGFPCGSCRQVIIEQEGRHNQPIPLYVMSLDGPIYMITTVQDILPFAFSKNNL